MLWRLITYIHRHEAVLIGHTIFGFSVPHAIEAKAREWSERERNQVHLVGLFPSGIFPNGAASQ